MVPQTNTLGPATAKIKTKKLKKINKIARGTIFLEETISHCSMTVDPNVHVMSHRIKPLINEIFLEAPN